MAPIDCTQKGMEALVSAKLFGRLTGPPSGAIRTCQCILAALSQTLYRCFNRMKYIHIEPATNIPCTVFSHLVHRDTRSPKLLIYKFHYSVQSRAVPRANKSNEHVKCLYFILYPLCRLAHDRQPLYLCASNIQSILYMLDICVSANRDLALLGGVLE